MLCTAVVCDCIQKTEASKRKSLEQQRKAGLWGVKNSCIVCERTNTCPVAACGQARILSCQNKCKQESKTYLPVETGEKWIDRKLRYPHHLQRALIPQVGNQGEKLGESKVGHKPPICTCKCVNQVLPKPKSWLSTGG